MSLEEQYDEVRQLIELGKEKGYLLYDEVNELLPTNITRSDALDELFTAFGDAGSRWLTRNRRTGSTSCSTGAAKAWTTSSRI